MVTIVYLCAGMSSRFGGKIKQFAQVGPKGETLIELSMQQAIKAGFSKIVFVVGEKTEKPFKEKFGVSFGGTPIEYTKQTFESNKRDKPWGTVDALVCAKSVVDEDFVLCNGDDVYGEEALAKAKYFLEEKKQNIIIGFELGKNIPDKGSVNRGIIFVENNGFVKEIKEFFSIEKDKLSENNLSVNSISNANLIGLKKEVLKLLENKLLEFKSSNTKDRKAECLLPTELTNLINEKKIILNSFIIKEKVFGITNPNDEEIVRAELKDYYSQRKLPLN